MATSKRVQTRAAVPGFSSISIVTLAILCLLSIASVAALPHISSPGLLEDDSLAFSRRDETDPPPAYGDTSTFPSVPGPPAYGAPPGYDDPLRYERPDLEEKLTTMTDDYPLVTELPLGEVRKGKQPPKQWTFSLEGEQKLLEIPLTSGLTSDRWAWDDATFYKNSRTQFLQLGKKMGEKKAVQTVSDKAGLVWSTLLDKSAGSKFILDMQLLYTNKDCPKWWTVAPPRKPLSKDDFYRMENNEPPVPFKNRLLRTLDVIEGIAHMHNQSLSYFYLSTGSVNVVMEDPTEVPKEFKGKKWIRQLQLSQFRHASDIKAYESRGPLASIRSTDLNYCQSSGQWAPTSAASAMANRTCRDDQSPKGKLQGQRRLDRGGLHANLSRWTRTGRTCQECLH